MLTEYTTDKSIYSLVELTNDNIEYLENFGKLSRATMTRMYLWHKYYSKNNSSLFYNFISNYCNDNLYIIVNLNTDRLSISIKTDNDIDIDSIKNDITNLYKKYIEIECKDNDSLIDFINSNVSFFINVLYKNTGSDSIVDIFL